jgi:hypothetical protein
MRETMPEQDITLGEVYRAVLAIREDVQQTRTEIMSSHNTLSTEQNQQALAMKENEVNVRHLTERVLALETIKLNSVDNRIQALELHPKSSADNVSRALLGALAVIGAALQWWFNKP